MNWLAAVRRELTELQTAVSVLQTRLDQIEPATIRGTGAPSASGCEHAPNPILDAVGDALDALGFPKD